MAGSRNDNFDNNYDIGSCYLCKTLCTNKCSRCDEFYCSLKCQKNDWKNHRHVCFKMPYLKMGPPLPNEYTNNNSMQGSNPRLHNGFHRTNGGNRSLEENLSSTSSTSSLGMRNRSEPKKILFGEPPKNNDDVVLTWVFQTNSYYIRPFRSSSEYSKNYNDFHQHGLNANKLQHIPEKNDIVLVRWDQHFVRGLVLDSFNNDNIYIALIDIGGTTHKPLSYLREISDELLERKRFNFKIGLDIGHVGDQEYQKLLNFVRKGTVFRLQFDGDTFTTAKNVKLFEKASGSALDQLLRSASTSATVQVTPIPEPSQQTTQSIEPQTQLEKDTKTFITDLTLETLPENVVDLLVLDTSTITIGCISVIELKNVDKLSRLQQRIKDIVKDLSEEYEPENNEVCLTKFADDQEWYRAEYIADCDQFSFIDYGNYSSVERKDVRKLPLSLRDPCYTVYCHIDNFTTLSTEGRGKLTESLLQNEVQKGCIVKKVLGDGEEDEEEVHITLDFLKH